MAYNGRAGFTRNKYVTAVCVCIRAQLSKLHLHSNTLGNNPFGGNMTFHGLSYTKPPGISIHHSPRRRALGRLIKFQNPISASFIKRGVGDDEDTAGEPVAAVSCGRRTLANSDGF